jgi:hypothetical protein
MSGAVSILRAKLKAANARIAELETQTAEEVLAGAATHPTIANAVILQNLRILLKSRGEEVKPHDNVYHKVMNIVAAKNSAMQTMRELTKTPASYTLKDALRIIIGYRLTDLRDTTRHVDADVFLQKSIVKALLREIDAERTVT